MKNIQDIFYTNNINKDIIITFNVNTFTFQGPVTLIGFDKYVILVKYNDNYYLINKNNVLYVKIESFDEAMFDSKPKGTRTVPVSFKQRKGT